MNLSVLDLPWLASPPDDFSAQCRSLNVGDERLGVRLHFLASHRLTSVMAASLGRAVVRCRRGGANLAPLSPFRLGVLSNTTADILADSFVAAAARHGVDLELVLAPYDQVMQQAMDPGSIVNSSKLDAVLLAVDFRWLQLQEFDAGAAQRRIDEISNRYDEVLRNLREWGRVPAIVQTIALPSRPLFGNFDRRVRDTARAIVDEVNARLVGLARNHGAYIFDVAALAERVGTDQWFDPVKWHHFKLPFANTCNEVYADGVGRILGAIRGKSRKCLVLDLDNTLWGGAIGDEGLDGIVLGQGNPLGEAFLSVQAMALALRRRGIVLAVCSKNNHDVAVRAFREHPDMLLDESHISVFQANWIDKASNLEAIAKSLNIGIDSLVFLDDNPAERAHVRAAHPSVAVPELPSDPSWYPWILTAAGYFEAVAFSEEDLIRASAYEADTRRAEVLSQTRDLGDYLSSLKMEIGFSAFDAANRQRIVQLINKSNQFNLTTRRYTEVEVAGLEVDAGAYTLQVRLADAWGKLGMIAVVICRPTPDDGEVWEIDTWLMSCRVLGRKVEEVMLAEVVRGASNAGARLLRGIYRPTEKNNMVAEHYGKLGFALIEQSPEGIRHYHLAVQDYQAENLPFVIERS